MDAQHTTEAGEFNGNQKTWLWNGCGKMLKDTLTIQAANDRLEQPIYFIL
jgi:hypothetical protein